MSQIKVANFSIGQFFKSASMFTPTSSIVTISAISSGSITFTPALSNYTTIRSASLSWLDSSSLSPFYSITGGGSFQSIDSTAFSVLFSFGSTTTIVTQSNSSFIFNSSSIVGASTRQFSISYLTQSIQSYYDDTVEEAYVQLTIDTTNNENSIKFDTGLFNSTTGEVEFTSNTPVKGGIGTSARGIGSFAMGSGSIAQESASIAEGINTLASGLASHAAGINTTASGQAAFSMGIETDADGMASFAAGSGSWARGDSSVAMGIGTIASSSGQVTIGHFNFPLNSPDHLFVVGGGTANTPLSSRGNLLEVYGGIGSTYKAVKIDVGSTFTQTSAPPQGFSIYGNTTFNGNVTGSNFNAIGNDLTIQLPGFTITTGSFTSNFYRRQAVLGGGPEDFEDVLKASVRLDHRGINFSLSEQTTAPGSTFLWTNSSNRLFYSSSAVILNGGNTLGSTMLIGTNDTNNLELETGGTTRVFISSSGNVGIGTSSPTERLHVLGNSLFSGSLKFEPTQDPDLAGLDTDSTILFQSSSNTLLGYDLYFRQNGNLVKWKWFEGLLESGLLYGGVVTYSGSFVYVSPGSGILVDHNAVTGSEIGPLVDYVTWGPITQSITNIATQQLTYIYIDDTGALQQQSTAFTSQQYHSSIPLGAVAHFNYNSIGSFGGSVQTSYDQTSQILTFVDAFGPLKISGYGITGQTSSLQISVGSGVSFIHGGFYDNDPQFPSEILTTSQLTASIVYVHRSGSGVKFDSNNNNYFTSLRPGFYDPGTGNTASLSHNNWTIQRAYSEPKTGIVYVYYGQNVYTTYNEAVANVSSDSFTEGDTFNYTTFLGFLILKSDTTDITNTSDNKIITAGLFRGGAGGAGGGSVVSSLDDLSDVSILSPTNGQALVYNSSTSLWGNGVPVTSSYALTASFITPTGTNAFVQGGNSFGTTALLGTNDTQDLQLETSGSVRMTISSSGNVGIGTATPLSTLTVAGGNINIGSGYSIGGNNLGTYSPFLRYNTNVGIPSSSFGHTTAYITSLGGSIFGANDLIFYAGAVTHTYIMRIVGSTGFVGIGESSPSAKLEIKGSGATSATTALRVENSAATALLTMLNDGTSAFNTSHLYVSASGNVGIGTTAPLAELHISGANNDSLFRIQSPSSASIMFVSGSGNVGLGTLTPTATLEIASTGSATLGQAQIYLNTAAVGRNRIDFNTVGLGVPATTTRSDGTKITLYPAISATQTDIALGVAFPAGVGEFWSSVYASTISFSWYAAATQIMRLVGDGQLRLGAGTAALPVISAGLSGTDTNTGIYFPTADTIGLVTGGTERARITSAGSASIGTITSTPSATLHVSGANNVTLLRVASPGSADALVVSGSGNVGIGLTSPLARLHISGANSLRMQNTGFDTFEWFFSAGTGIGFRNVTDGTTPFFVGGTDDIGIGTTNTSAKLHVSGASNSNLLRVGSPTDSNILFITGSGRVGVGTTTPDSKLHISSNSGYQLRVAASASFSSSLMVSGSFGYVGIGVESPQSILHVNDRPEFNNVTGNVPVAFIGNYQNITTFYNNNSQDNTVLGDPAAWMSIKCDGTEYLIPLYTS